MTESSIVYSKTAKGITEVSRASSSLPRALRAILKEIDGKTPASELRSRFGKHSDADWRKFLQVLENDGYIRDASPTPVPVLVKAAQTKDAVDLDFTSIAAEPSKELSPAEKRAAAKREAEQKVELLARIRARQETEEQARQTSADKARRDADEKVKQALLAKAKQEADERAKREAEAKARREAEAKAKLEAEEKSRRAAEEKARKEIQARERREAQERARLEAVEQARREAEERARLEMAEKARREAEEKRKRDEAAAAVAKAEAEKRAREEAELKRQREEREKARLDAIEKTRREAEARARQEAEAQARREAEERARQIAEEKRRHEAEEKARLEAEAKTRREAEQQARIEAEERARREAEERVKAEAEDGERKVAEAQARREAESRAKADAEEKARLAAEEQARREREEAMRREAEAQAQREAEERSRREAEAKARIEAEERQRKEAEELASREAEAQAQREAEEKARQAAEERVRVEAEEQRRREAEEAARREAEALEREAAAERARLEAETRAKAEAEEQIRLAAEEQARREREEEERRQAEDRARKEAEEAARLEAERQQRLAVWERAKLKAEARLEQETSEKARREAEEKARMEEAERLRREEEALTAAKGAALPVEDDELVQRKARIEAELQAAELAARRAQQVKKLADVRWGKVTAIVIVVALVIALVRLHIVSFDERIPEVQAIASERLGQPVTVDALYFSLFPRPRWHAQGVRVGGAEQITVHDIDAFIDVRRTFSEGWSFSNLTLRSPFIKQEALAWLLYSKASARALSVASVKLRAATLLSPGIDVPRFDADAALEADGNWRQVDINVGDRDALVTMHPDGERIQYELTSISFLPPFGGTFAFDDLTARGAFDRNGVTVEEFEGRNFGGTLTGKARIDWNEAWSIAGTVKARQPDARRLAPALLGGGRVDGLATFSMRAKDARTLFAAPRLEGDFSVSQGEVLGIDLMHLLKNGGDTRKTAFRQLTGKFVRDGDMIELRQVRLDSGMLSAAGALDIANNGVLRGRFTTSLTFDGRQTSGAFNLNGTREAPKFSR